MCGISVLIDQKNKLINSKVIQSMTDIISHRGPDGEGFYYGDHFAFGHRRLAIIDINKRSNQPMQGPDGLVITYNGEIYNYIELRDKLQPEGYTFKTDSDTEVLLAAYHFWGKDCLHQLNGMWAFAIYDPRNNEIFVARDRFGIKPLYYSTIGDYFAMASEIKQFTTLPQWKACANHACLYDYIVAGAFEQSHETMFDGVTQIRGGQSMTLSLSSFEKKLDQWYVIEDHVKTQSLSDNDADKHYYDLFKDSIRLRLRSDVNVGSCLSGGLDSSSIVCIMNQLLNNNGNGKVQHTISSCFEDKAYDEQEYIDDVLKHTNTKGHKVFPSDETLFNDIEKIIWHQDEPFGSTSIFAQWTVFEKAEKENLKVMLDGQGADEQLAGYHSFFVPLISDYVKKGKLLTLVSELRLLKQHHQIRYRHIFSKVIYHILPISVKKMLSNKKHQQLNSWLKPCKHKLNVQSMRSLRQTSLHQINTTSLPSLLHYEDRSSMAKSIEARVPFLDYRLVEFVVSLNNEKKIKNGITKQVLRNGLKTVLPEKIMNRVDKLGFVTEEEKWMRNNKEKVLAEIDNDWPDYIDKNKLLKTVKNVLDSNKSFDFLIWRLYCVQKWKKVFNIQF